MTTFMSVVEEKKQKLLEELRSCATPEDRYRFIIQKGKELAPLPEEKRLDKFLVEGCTSRAWLVPEMKEGRLYFNADSEASIVKGIIALLLEVYSGQTPEQILKTDAGFLSEGGVTEHLSMNRRSGLSSMVKQVKLYAAAVRALQS